MINGQEVSQISLLQSSAKNLTSDLSQRNLKGLVEWTGARGASN